MGKGFSFSCFFCFLMVDAWLQRTSTELCKACTPVAASASRRGGLRSSWVNLHAARAFSVAGPVCWNALPDYLKSPDISFDGFSQQLKHFYFADIYYYYHYSSALETLLARSSANSKLSFFLCASTMFDFY